jgi:hypothetical protein
MREHRTPSGLTILMRQDAQPVGRCNVCGVPFFSREEGERHMGPCAREHLGEIQEQRAKSRIAMFDEENWDPELRAHLDKVGKRMVAEGRLEMKPNERGGF